jgi:phosphonatase-like hydrolase
MIRMVVFDMAGTTIDEDNIVYKTVQKALGEHGYSFTLDQVLTEGAGKEKLQAIKSILGIKGIHDDQISSNIYQYFLIQLKEAYASLHVKPQPHAEEVFELLRQQKILVILNTGYDSDTALSLVRKLGWKKDITFDAMITASDVKNGRPHPDMILHAMKIFELHEPGEVVKVGDSVIDIEEGRNAQCALSIGITTGAHTKDQLEKASPDFIISDLSELLNILENCNREYHRSYKN